MLDYYLYLWKATWIESSLFLILYIFVLGRLVWKARSVLQQGVTRWRASLLVLKGLAWMGILAGYLVMLHSTEPDWFSKPQWIQGEVQGKAMTQSSLYPYTVEIRSESISKTLVIDDFSYRALSSGQKVKISYLPYRLEVVTCEVLQ